ncbi:TPA: AAA family ATPase, partial [Klebsiella aerogenes]|nr:AAA family ATPase [Klebsiella aerogenes]
MLLKPKLTISEIFFSGGQRLTLNNHDKILIVGPNNSGKSQTLREIISTLENSPPERKVTLDVTFNKIGSNADMEEYLTQNSHFQNHTYHIGPAQVIQHQINFWQNSKTIYSLTSMFVKNITAKDRLNICEQQTSISFGEPKTKPQHILYDDSELMERISSTFKKAFNKDLAFDYRGGSKLPIHLIDKKDFPENTDRVSNEYIDKLRKHPLLDKQGDGIKGYAGILFEAIAFNYDISLIDEPEAFLHPPQMRRLGQTLAEEVKGQLIVATHSSDIMRGFLEGTKGDLKIIRIHREGDKNIIHEVNQEAIKELWSKPNLRYSNALDSIFHEQVIICEDDSDCRLINYTADYLADKSDVVFPDTAFVPSGGKHAISGIAEILRLTGVPVKAIYDFDLLSERNTFMKALDSFGCSKKKKERIMNLWSQINSEVMQKTRQKSDDEIKNLLLKTINETDAKKVSKGMLE